MNQEKVGKFIAECRKKKKITQEELAEKLGITNKAVSKWENGYSMPDCSIFRKLCNELNISINELLNGELESKEQDEVVIEYLECKNKQQQKKYIKFVIFISLIFIASLLTLYFINSYKKINVYKLSGESENFYYENGMILTSNIKNIIVNGSLNSEKIKKDDILDIEFAFEKENEYYHFTGYCDNCLQYEKYGYDELIPVEYLPYVEKNLYILIYYLNSDEVVVEKMKVNTEKILSNDKFISFKTSSISKEYTPELINLNRYNNSLSYEEWLISKGFTYEKNSKTNCSDCLEKKISDNEYIAFNVKNNMFVYKLKTDELEISTSFDVTKIDDDLATLNIRGYKNGKAFYLMYAINNGDRSGSSLSDEIPSEQFQRIIDLMKEYSR